MEFKQWFLQEAKTEDILIHVYKSISNLLDGQWVILGRKKYAITYEFQMKEHMDIGGANVKKFGDRFRVRCFVIVKKKPGNIEPYPELFKGGWSYKKDVEWLKPYDPVAEYNPQIGHKLISFYGGVEGGLVGHEDIGKYSSTGIAVEDPHENPFASFKDLLKHDPFREDLDNIGSFENLHTPMEVAQYVKKCIDNFNPGKDDDGGNEPTPVSPRDLVKV